MTTTPLTDDTPAMQEVALLYARALGISYGAGITAVRRYVDGVVWPGKSNLRQSVAESLLLHLQTHPVRPPGKRLRSFIADIKAGARIEEEALGDTYRLVRRHLHKGQRNIVSITALEVQKLRLWGVITRVPDQANTRAVYVPTPDVPAPDGGQG